MTVTERWTWRMDWCKRQGMSPANSAIWDMSGSELEKYLAIQMKTDEEIVSDIRQDLFLTGE